MRISKILAAALFLWAASCGESEREEAQQRQYETQLQQQVIETDQSFQTDLAELLDNYFDLKDALVESNADDAASLAREMVRISEEVDAAGLNEETSMIWSAFADGIIANGNQMAGETDIEDQRYHFEEISKTMIQVTESFHPAGYAIYVQSCPMVRDGSADWLSREENIRNPYHGDRMLRCGEVLRQI